MHNHFVEVFRLFFYSLHRYRAIDCIAYIDKQTNSNQCLAVFRLDRNRSLIVWQQRTFVFWDSFDAERKLTMPNEIDEVRQMYILQRLRETICFQMDFTRISREENRWICETIIRNNRCHEKNIMEIEEGVLLLLVLLCLLWPMWNLHGLYWWSIKIALVFLLSADVNRHVLPMEIAACFAVHTERAYI